jgi:hypothetical protein
MLPTLFAMMACNGDPALCDRRYDQVTYATTHNATAVRRGKYAVRFIANQERDVDVQLADGIRALMIDVWHYNGFQNRKKGSIYTCHQECALGGQPLQRTLNKIKVFLENHPNEVLSLLIEDHVQPSELMFELIQAGLAPLLFRKQTLGSSYQWPTLREMIQLNQRLVVFTENKTSVEIDSLLPLFKLATETQFSVKRRVDLDCQLNRGNSKNSLFVLNHFITRGTFRRARNRSLNQMTSLLNRAKECFAQTNKIPNFLTVDFYQTGSVVQASKLLNRIWANQSWDKKTPTAEVLREAKQTVGVF